LKELDKSQEEAFTLEANREIEARLLMHKSALLIKFVTPEITSHQINILYLREMNQILLLNHSIWIIRPGVVASDQRNLLTKINNSISIQTMKAVLYRMISNNNR
jgi:hypothetical protein